MSTSTNVRWRILALATGYSFLNQFNRISMAVAADMRIMDEFQISTVAMGTVYSAFLLGYTIFMTPGGWLIDRVGFRRTLALMGFGSAVFIYFTGISGWVFLTAAPLWWALVIIRGGMGIVSAPLYPSVAEVAKTWFPPQQRALANGLMLGASPLGIALAYVVFGNLIRAFDWPAAFILTGTLTTLLAAVWWFYATDRPDLHRGVSSEERALIGPIHPLGDRILASNAQSLPPDSIIEPSVSPKKSLFKDRGLLLITLSYTADSYFTFLFFYWMNYYFTKELKLGDAAQWYASLPPLAMAVGIPLGGWISDRIAKTYGAAARSRVAVFGLVLSGLLLLAGVSSTNLTTIVVCFSLALGAIGLSETSFWIVAVERGGARGGTAAGFLNTGGCIGGMCAPVFTPWIGQHFGWPVAIGFGGLVGLIGAACWLGVPFQGGSNSEREPATEAKIEAL